MSTENRGVTFELFSIFCTLTSAEASFNPDESFMEESFGSMHVRIRNARFRGYTLTRGVVEALGRVKRFAVHLPNFLFCYVVIKFVGPSI